MFGIDNRYVQKFVVFMQNLRNIGIWCFGIPVLMYIDLFMGANYLGSRFTYLKGPLAPYIPFAISVATSAIQLGLWHIWMFRDKTRRHVGQYLALGAMIIIMLGDSFLDLGGITAMVKGNKHLLSVLAPFHVGGTFDIGYVMILLVVGPLCLFNEPVTMWLVDRAQTHAEAELLRESPAADAAMTEGFDVASGDPAVV